MSDREEPEVEYDDYDDEAYINDRIWHWIEGLVQDACDLIINETPQQFLAERVTPVRESFEPSVKDLFHTWHAILNSTGEEFTQEQQRLMVDMAGVHMGVALYHADRDDDDSAWEEVNFANHWLSLLRGYLDGQKKNPPQHIVREYAEKRVAEVIKQRYRDAAIKGHAADHSNEAFAGEWLNAHFVQDKHTNESAAEALGKVVTGAFGTRLGYVKRWRKSRRLKATQGIG